MKRIELDAPNISFLEKEYLNKCLESGFISTFGPFVTEFENKFAAYVNNDKAVAVQSGTAALHMALLESGVGKGDEVIVPALTFVATVNPVMYLGAKPVFVDVDLKTWNISPESVKKNISKKTKAIIPVHLYGNPCDMTGLMAIAEKNNIRVIEDATESLGALFNGKSTGTFGDFGCFSFNGNKVITTGGGGMVIGRDSQQLDHIRFLINQAKSGDGNTSPEIGYNYRLTNLEASIGLAQMEKLNDFLTKKKEFHAIYQKEFASVNHISLQENYRHAQSSHWFTCVALKDNYDVAVVIEKLKQKGIPTRRVFMPIVEFNPYKAFKKDPLINSYKIYQGGLCLPSSTLNTADDIRHVCEIVKEVVQNG